MSPRHERRVGNVYFVRTSSHSLWLVALRDSSYGVALSDPSSTTVRRQGFIGTYGIFDTFIRSGVWKLVGSVRFGSAEDEWPNPTRLHELSDPEGKYVYYEGRIQEAARDVSSLNVAQLFKPLQFASFIDEFLSKAS